MKISVRVKTRAKAEKVERAAGGNFVIWVKAVPTDGKANRAVLQLLADYFDVAPSSLRIVSGHTNRDKIIAIAESKG